MHYCNNATLQCYRDEETINGNTIKLIQLTVWYSNNDILEQCYRDEETQRKDNKVNTTMHIATMQ